MHLKTIHKVALTICLLGSSVIMESHGALAQSAQDLARLEKDMAEQKAAAAELEKKEKAAAADLDQLRQKLITATRETQDKQTELNELEKQLIALEKEAASKADKLFTSQERMAALTSALIQLSREPPELFVLHEESADDQVHKGIILRSLLPSLREEVTLIAEDIEKYESLQEQANAKKKLLIAAKQNLQWQKGNLDQMVKARQGFLTKTQAEKEALAKQLEALANEAQDLKQLIEKVAAPSWGRTVGKSLGKTPNLKPGLLKPAAGTIIRDFGEADSFGVKSDGVTISASGGSPVVAPQSGRVVFAGPFKGYGQIIILQHSGGFHSFLSGFARIDTEMGQNVDAGEPLGVLPDEGSKKAELYFEWRKGTDPVDPTVNKK